MADFGNFLTNQYGLLKQIFSHLPARDLLIASEVCRRWKVVAKRVQLENNTVQIYNRKENEDWPAFSDRVKPKLILHFLNSKVLYYETTGQTIPTTEAFECPVFSVKNFWYITSEISPNLVEVFNEQGFGSHSVLLLSEMIGVKIDIFFPSQKGAIKTYEKTVTNSKCCILICDSKTASVKNIQSFLESLPNPQKLSLAGGVAEKQMRFGRGGLLHCSQRCDALGIAFSGENVESCSNIHEPNVDVNDFMKNFAKAVGPKPLGAERLAFMFVCVNRENLYDEEETTIFSKHFPLVPVYGFWSFGEFCIPKLDNGETGEPCEKRQKVEEDDTLPKNNGMCFFYEGCTSYIVITFKKPKI